LIARSGRSSRKITSSQPAEGVFCTRLYTGIAVAQGDRDTPDTESLGPLARQAQARPHGRAKRPSRLRRHYSRRAGSNNKNSLRESRSCRCTPSLARSHSHETLDLFLTREAAEAELREILEDEPDWKDILRVVPIELDERAFSDKTAFWRAASPNHSALNSRDRSGAW
jgi:hypothetical protein